MLNTTSKVPAEKTPCGLAVIPDRLIIPVVIAATGATPNDAAGSVASHARALSEQIGTEAIVEMRQYASWTEKLAGKSLRGATVRQHAKGKLHVRRDFAAEVDFVERVQALENLRTLLAVLDQESEIAVGAAQWCISDPESYREAAIRELSAKLKVASDAFDTSSFELRGTHALQVNVVGPTSAFIEVDITATMLGPNSGGALTER